MTSIGLQSASLMMRSVTRRMNGTSPNVRNTLGRGLNDELIAGDWRDLPWSGVNSVADQLPYDHMKRETNLVQRAVFQVLIHVSRLDFHEAMPFGLDFSRFSIVLFKRLVING